MSFSTTTIRTAYTMFSVLRLLLIISCTTHAAAEQEEEIMTDGFGIAKLYASDPDKSHDGDWVNKWSVGSERTLKWAGEADPQDERTVMRGSSDEGITIGSGECIFHPGTTRLFINNQYEVFTNSSSYGFEDVEFTAYAKWEHDGDETSNAGFTMIGRTNHFFKEDDGCNAAGYYMRVWKNPNKGGLVSFQKEYYHDSVDIVYSRGIYEDLFDGFPKNQWIGLKFVIFTIPGTEDVQLELYVDLTDGRSDTGGGDWALVHRHVDQPGGWPAKVNLPSRCPVGNGDTILGGGHSCTLRTDGGEVHWKKASVRHILPVLLNEDTTGSRPPTSALTPPTSTAAPTSSAPTPTTPPQGTTTSPTPPTPITTTATTRSAWSLITYDDFEDGMGNYISGGTNDAELYEEGEFSHEGSNGALIRDNNGDGSFITHRSVHDVSGFNLLRASFWFFAFDMDDQEDFWLQYSTDGGGQWITAAAWIHGVDFDNDQFYLETVLIDSSQMTSGIQLRFRCNGSDSTDQIVVDEIRFEGKA